MAVSEPEVVSVCCLHLELRLKDQPLFGRAILTAKGSSEDRKAMLLNGSVHLSLSKENQKLC